MTRRNQLRLQIWHGDRLLHVLAGSIVVPCTRGHVHVAASGEYVIRVACRASAAAQAGEAQLAVARKEALQQKRSLQQQLKDEVNLPTGSRVGPCLRM